MSSAMVPSSPPDRSPEPLWHLVQFKMIQAFNADNEAKRKSFKCWPIFQISTDKYDPGWMVVIITDEIFVNAKSTCHIRIGGRWFEATRVNNPATSIGVEGKEYQNFATYRVKVPPTLNDKQPRFTPLEMVRGPEDGALRPVFSVDKMLSANLHLEIKSSPQLDDMIERKAVPEASWKFQDPKHYRDIYRWGTDEEFEFEAEAIRDFNRKSVCKCWLLLCHPSNDELPGPGSKGIMRQQCLVIMAVPDLTEEFPRVGELCDLAFAHQMPPLGKDVDTTKDNKKLKRRGLKYLGGTRLDNPYEKFDLDDGSECGSSWAAYCTFKVSVYKESASDYSPLDDFACKLNWSMVSKQHDGSQKSRLTLDSASAFQAHVWLDISTTTRNVELNALKKAMEQPVDSRVGKAFSYIRTFGPVEKFNLFQAFPHMHLDSQLPQNLKPSFQRLDENQKHVYRTVLAGLPARVGIIPGGAGTGKTDLMLAISALALSARRETQMYGGPVLLILEANRPANAAATRVVQYFEKLGRTDLRILRAYNFNYEGLWNAWLQSSQRAIDKCQGTRRYLKVDDSGHASSGLHFDECFQTHRPDHVPQLRTGCKGDCLAPNLKEAAQQYLTEHLEDFPLMSELLSAEQDEIQADGDFDDESLHVEWDALFSRVLKETDFVITTPVGSYKISPYFHPRLVIFDEAARARELATLAAIAFFPSAEAWLFTGTVEMTKPYLASHGSKLWNPCANQLRTSLMARYLDAVPDTHRLSLNHQAYGDLHCLSSDLFWDGQIDSALPMDDRFPPSTAHLLEFCRSLATKQTFTVPRLLVHVRSPRTVHTKPRRNFNENHLKWVIHCVVRHLVQDPQFRTTDGNESGSIIITTPYKAQFTNYRKAINGLMKDLDREHRLSDSRGGRLHREVQVEARTADTVQGHAADFVITDLVTSRITPHVADPNRLCVALTRAKQAEIIVMEQCMLWHGREGPAHFRRGFGGSHIHLLYEHCRSRGQVITVDPVTDLEAKKDYSLHRDDTGTGRELSAVPRQLPALPSSIDLPQDGERADAPPSTAASNISAPEGNDDDDVESMFGRGGKFGFDMVRKAMKVGLKLPADGGQCGEASGQGRCLDRAQVSDSQKGGGKW